MAGHSKTLTSSFSGNRQKKQVAVRKKNRSVKPKKTAVKKKPQSGFLYMMTKAMVKALIVNITLILIGVATFHIYKYCTTSPHFEVVNVNIKGNVSIDNSEIMNLAGSIKGENIFKIDIKAILARIEKHPMIKSISVEKEYPSKIIISVVEKTPFAILRNKNKNYIIDEEGSVLSQSVSQGTLIPITGINIRQPISIGTKVSGIRLAKGIELLKKFQDEISISLIDLKTYNRPVIIQSDSNLKMIVENKHIKRSISNYKSLKKVLKNKMDQIEIVDLSLSSKAIVTWKPVALASGVRGLSFKASEVQSKRNDKSLNFNLGKEVTL